jgi:glycosyltransferase involved in cell wall biosynthesis
MRIVIFYRYFYPDTPPYATMLREISGWLAEAGHEVTVFTAQPSYKPSAGVGRQPSRERIGAVSIVRLPLFPEHGPGLIRAANSLLFVLMSTICLLFLRRVDLAWTATMPPVVQGLLLSMVARLKGLLFLYHMHDIYPEVGTETGVITHGLSARLLRRLDTSTLGRAQAVVVLSRDMKQALRNRGHDCGNVTIINNYALASEEPVRPPEGVRNSAPKRFVFAGNIGRFQNLTALVEAFGLVNPELAVLDLLGDGRMKAELERLVQQKGYRNIRFHNHIDARAAFEFICDRDVAIVSLQPGLFRYAYPSKTLTYLAAGLPILAMVEAESELAATISERGAGRVVPWSLTPEELASAIRDMCVMGSERRRPGALADLYAPATARAKWTALISGLEKQLRIG